MGRASRKHSAGEEAFCISCLSLSTVYTAFLWLLDSSFLAEPQTVGRRQSHGPWAAELWPPEGGFFVFPVVVGFSSSYAHSTWQEIPTTASVSLENHRAPGIISE